MTTENCCTGSLTKPQKCRYMNYRAKTGMAYCPTDVEQLANMVTHGLWVVPSLLGLMWMCHLAVDSTQYYVALVYGFALIALFSTSTCFHTISYSKKYRTLQEIFHYGDRAVIYFFIAASYTPWLALKDFGGIGNYALYIVWLLAICGILYQYIFHEKYKWLETFFYVSIGLGPALCVIAEMKEPSGLTELALGGGMYIVGVFFFKSDGRIPFAHAIWHCFVFVGALFHFCGVCRYLLGEQNIIRAEMS